MGHGNRGAAGIDPSQVLGLSTFIDFSLLFLARRKLAPPFLPAGMLGHYNSAVGSYSRHRSGRAGRHGAYPCCPERCFFCARPRLSERAARPRADQGGMGFLLLRESRGGTAAREDGSGTDAPENPDACHREIACFGFSSDLLVLSYKVRCALDTSSFGDLEISSPLHLTLFASLLLRGQPSSPSSTILEWDRGAPICFGGWWRSLSFVL